MRRSVLIIAYRPAVGARTRRDTTQRGERAEIQRRDKRPGSARCLCLDAPRRDGNRQGKDGYHSRSQHARHTSPPMRRGEERLPTVGSTIAGYGTEKPELCRWMTEEPARRT